MSRKLVWIERDRFRGFGCSECGWRFKPSGTPAGTSFAEMIRNFQLQRDKEFRSHVCASKKS
jgi:rubredoxin